MLSRDLAMFSSNVVAYFTAWFARLTKIVFHTAKGCSWNSISYSQTMDFADIDQNTEIDGANDSEEEDDIGMDDIDLTM